jgi:hypothetical protein
MRRFLSTMLAAGLGALGAGAANAQYNIGQASQLFTNTTNAGTGFVGNHLMSATADPNNLSFGVSFDLGNASSYTPEYEMGLERGNTDFYILSRLFSPYSAQFRLRGDTGQIEMGPAVGHPGSTAQVNVTGGTAAAPLTGVRSNAYGDHSGLALIQLQAGSLRTKINLNNQFYVGTDKDFANVGDFYIMDTTGPRYPLWVSAPTSSTPDLVNLPYGATITGGATVNGLASLNSGATIAGNLQHTGSQLGFYGKSPVQRPAVTGARCDGTALASLLHQLDQMGLIQDQSTP